MFRETTADEITKIVGLAPVKHCSLDPAPTSLVKRLMPLLAGTLAEMVNAPLRGGIFPNALKHAMVRPRLKKMSLDHDDVSSYRRHRSLT